MKNFYKRINQKVSNIIHALFGTGIVLVMLAILIVAEEFLFRLLVGILVMLIAFMFFYGAYKLHTIRKEVKKRLNF